MTSGASPNGNLFTAEDVATTEAKLPDAVDAPTAWVMRKTLFAALVNRRSGGGDGEFLFRPAGGGLPRDLAGTKVVRSSQVSATRAKGTATDLTYAVLGYFPDWVVRSPRETPKMLNIKRLRKQHRSCEVHEPAWFPPHSVHYSVHEKTRQGPAGGHLVGNPTTLPPPARIPPLHRLVGGLQQSLAATDSGQSSV